MIINDKRQHNVRVSQKIHAQLADARLEDGVENSPQASCLTQTLVDTQKEKPFKLYHS